MQKITTAEIMFSVTLIRDPTKSQIIKDFFSNSYCFVPYLIENKEKLVLNFVSIECGKPPNLDIFGIGKYRWEGPDLVSYCDSSNETQRTRCVSNGTWITEGECKRYGTNINYFYFLIFLMLFAKNMLDIGLLTTQTRFYQLK